ncbi:MAG: hypothetical protein LBL66_09755 [Clostridiales bacterium]|jgi:hypothetical protein|nr:hypothetical protein [Clostridiales bacterium]
MTKTESAAVRDVYSAREKIYEETKGMTAGQYHAYLKKLAENAARIVRLPPAIKANAVD